METLNRYGDNHRNRDCAHGPRQVLEPARGFHADLGAAWHLNCAPGRCRRDPRPKGSSRPAQSWAARPPAAARIPRPAPRAHHRRSPSPPAPAPQSPQSKPLQPPASPARTAPRTRKPSPPPALLFKSTQSFHWPVRGGARRRSTGLRPQPRPTCRLRALSIGRARTRIRTPAVDWRKPGSRPGSLVRAGVPEERGPGLAGRGFFSPS